MKRAPQDLIQNKTAVFWLQDPFCSTSACQLAPLGKGRESRDFFGDQRERIMGNRRLESSNSRERINQNIQVLGEHRDRPSAAWGLSQTLWAPGVGNPHPPHRAAELSHPLQEKGIPLPQLIHLSSWPPHELCDSRGEMTSQKEMLFYPILVPKIRNPRSSLWGREKKN